MRLSYGCPMLCASQQSATHSITSISTVLVHLHSSGSQQQLPSPFHTPSLFTSSSSSVFPSAAQHSQHHISVSHPTISISLAQSHTQLCASGQCQGFISILVLPPLTIVAIRSWNSQINPIYSSPSVNF